LSTMHTTPVGFEAPFESNPITSDWAAELAEVWLREESTKTLVKEGLAESANPKTPPWRSFPEVEEEELDPSAMIPLKVTGPEETDELARTPAKPPMFTTPVESEEHWIEPVKEALEKREPARALAVKPPHTPDPLKLPANTTFCTVPCTAANRPTLEELLICAVRVLPFPSKFPVNT